MFMCPSCGVTVVGTKKAERSEVLSAARGETAKPVATDFGQRPQAAPITEREARIAEEAIAFFQHLKNHPEVKEASEHPGVPVCKICGKSSEEILKEGTAKAVARTTGPNKEGIENLPAADIPHEKMLKFLSDTFQAVGISLKSVTDREVSIAKEAARLGFEEGKRLSEAKIRADEDKRIADALRKIVSKDGDVIDDFLNDIIPDIEKGEI